VSRRTSFSRRPCRQLHPAKHTRPALFSDTFSPSRLPTAMGILDTSLDRKVYTVQSQLPFSRFLPPSFTHELKPWHQRQRSWNNMLRYVRTVQFLLIPGHTSDYFFPKSASSRHPFIGCEFGCGLGACLKPTNQVGLPSHLRHPHTPTGRGAVSTPYNTLRDVNEGTDTPVDDVVGGNCSVCRIQEKWVHFRYAANTQECDRGTGERTKKRRSPVCSCLMKVDT